jgi:hypothetical protein
MVDLDLIMKLLAHFWNRGWMYGGDLSHWLLEGKRERCPPQTQALMAMIMGTH